MIRYFLFLCTLLAPGFAPGFAAAATMTFDAGIGLYADADGDGLDDHYTENGITVQGFIFGSLSDFPAETAHLDNPGDGHFTDRLNFTFGKRFSLTSFALWPSGFECDLDICAGYKNVIVTGFRKGLTVAEHIFSMGFTPSLYVGTPPFANLDRLVISTIDGPPAYQFGNSHFSIDNVVLTAALAPVPVPPALPLLGLGLLTLWLAGKRPPPQKPAECGPKYGIQGGLRLT